MSENIPTDHNAPTSSASHKKPSKKSKLDKSKLPTPPPDPTEPKEPKEKDIYEYLESLIPNYSRSTSVFAPVLATEEAFDHLEKLYKLMEQMLELREQNAKLHRRIRDLEHLNNLEKMHKQLEIAGVERDCPELDRDTAFAETILESILADSCRKEPKRKMSTPGRVRPSILRRQRNRSNSGTEKQVTLDANVIVQQEDEYENRDKNAKVSKWTKVKAAFRWEKASTSVGVETKSQDSGIHVPVNMEIARYLRVPSTSDETGHSPADSGAAGISTPGSLSTASSNEDFHRSDRRTPYEDFRSSDEEHSHLNYIQHSKDDPSSSKPHQKYHRTPWAKMKDIIHTRNSFKKKHRLSAASDDIQIDVELCSDNEDNVFEDETGRSKSDSVQMSPAPSPNCRATYYVRVNSTDLPLDVIDRYQKAAAEDNDRRTSKWMMVKKAFLSADHQRSSSTSPKDNNADDEIQRSYRKLQKKLSLEFQEKLSEWERLKQSSPSTSNPASTSGFPEENRDPNFIKKMEEWQKIKSQSATKAQMPSEFDLPPEFKKKLQEWEKIKKTSGKESSGAKKKLGEVPRWKSLSGHRSETSTSTAFEYPPILSEDFRKKLDEWKQIKATGATTDVGQRKLKEKTPSPKLSRKNSSPKYVKKSKEQEKELHWFEKELGKIEKEKQRLERERQKFLEREERLSKLRRSMVGSNKKEVLVHTPSGFYRFEGISRKFTQKLYEWEKAQGIGPEASTFALLSSSYTPPPRQPSKRQTSSNTPSLMRSKSVDSIAISALNLTCPLMTQQPSSLSLNDVEELEKECLADSKYSSMQYLSESQEALDPDEPEAVLVEVEDYVEETAGPLQTFIQKHQLPIYQRQEVKTLCAGETVAAPKVRRSESARAQTNYNLIEEIVNILRHLAENEIEVKNLSQFGIKGPQLQQNKLKLKGIYESQKLSSSKIMNRILRLQEANATVASLISKEEASNSQGQMADILEVVQDLSNDILQMAEKMDHNINNRSIDNFTTTYTIYLTIFENIRDIRTKILELRRHLSYVCAASDLTAPNKKLSTKKKTLLHKTISNDSRSSRCDTSDNSIRSSQRERYIKSETSTCNSSQGAVKKRIKYRQKNVQSRSVPDTDEDEEDEAKEQRKCNRQHKKLTRSRTISDGDVAEVRPTSEPIVDETLSQTTLVPNETNYVYEDNKLPPDSPLEIFVKTTRKLFTPIGETTFNGNHENHSPNVDSPRILIETPPLQIQEGSRKSSLEDGAKSVPKATKTKETVTHLPPLPSSPVPQRKTLKDMSPSIRLMLTKYNQKISEQDGHSAKSGNSSGSNSPIAWRSPTSERRVKAQTERYQEELNKLSPLLGGRREVQKSASVGYLHTGNKQVTVPFRRDWNQDNPIPKSSSTNAMFAEAPKPPEVKPAAKRPLTLDISSSSAVSNKHSPEIRQKKLQKAKEEFLKSTPTSAPPRVSEEVLKFPTRNRLSQISVDSESSYDSNHPGLLIKSASAGMINIDPDTYRQIDPELHGGSYVSLPRNSRNPKSSKFGFSSIASKFRKVKMRKGKDKEKDKMNTISTLCRQSLVVDITIGTEDGQNHSNDGAGLPPTPAQKDDASPSTSSSRSNSWIKKSLFKK